MATITTTIRYASNLAELQNNLRQGVDQIETTTAAANRMAAALGGDKLIRSAHNTVAAINQIGGASKLTAAEQEKHLRVIDKAIEKMELMGQTVPKAMRETADALRQTAARIEESDGLLDRLGAKGIAAGAAIGTFLGNIAYDAAKKLATELFDLAKRGIELAPVVTSFQRLAGSIGQSGDEMLRVTRTASKGLISDLDLMASANKAMLLGLPVTAQSMGLMAQTAVTLGKAMKQGPVQSFDDLITALGRSSPMILDNLGLSVKVGEANDKYAASIGKTAEQLTDAEKKLAFYNAAMDAAKQKVTELGGIQLTLADRVQQVRTSFTNLTDALGVAIATSPVVNTAVGSIADAFAGAIGGDQTALVRTLTGYVNDLAIASIGVAEVLVDVGKVGTRTWTFLTDGVLGLVETQFRLRAVLRDLLPGEQYKKEAAELRRLADQYKTIVDNTYDQQARLEAGFATASTLLGTMRQRMEAARNENASSADIVALLTTRLTGAGEAGDKAGAGAKKAAEEVGKLVEQISGAKIDADIARTAEAVGRLKGQIDGAQLPGLVKQLQEWHAAGRRLPPLLEAIRVEQEGLNKALAAGLSFDAVAQAEQQADAWLKAMLLKGKSIDLSKLTPKADLGPPPGTFDQLHLNQMLGDWYNFNGEVIASNTKTAAKVLVTWKSFADKLGPTIASAVAGGGNAAAAVGSLMGQTIGEKLQEKLGPMLTKGLGKHIGGALSSLLPGVGALAGQLIGKGLSWINDKFFGGEGKKVNQLRDSFLKAQGGADALYKKLETIGRLDLWAPLMSGPGKMEAIEAAVGDIGEAFQLAERDAQALADFNDRLMGKFNGLLSAVEKFGGRAPAALRPVVQELLTMKGLTGEMQLLLDDLLKPADWHDVADAADRLGVSYDKLGKTFNQSRISESALQIVRDLDLIASSGADMDGVLRDAADSINKLVQDAMIGGLALPETLRPYIQRLIDLELLLDPSGNLIRNIDQLTFADIPDDALNAIKGILEEIRDLLAKGVPDAAAEAQKAIDGLQPPQWEWVDHPRGGQRRTPRAHTGAMVTAAGIRRFHSGIASVPRLAADEIPAILQTGEAVIRRSAVQALGGPRAMDALNRGTLDRGVTVVQNNSPVVHVHQAPTTDHRAAADEVVRQIAKGVGLADLKRAMGVR